MFQSSQQHAFLLAYRAICKELFLKRAAMEMSSFRRSLDRGKSIYEQVGLQEYLSLWDLGAAAGLREIESQKITYDDALVRSDYSEVKFYIVRLNKTPDVMCSGALQPQYDFEGGLYRTGAEEESNVRPER